MSTAFSLDMRRPTVSSSTPTSTTPLPKPSSISRKATSATSSAAIAKLRNVNFDLKGLRRAVL